MAKTENFDNSSLLVVEVLVSKHNTLEVIETKKNEMKSWNDNNMYQEVDKEGDIGMGR